MWFLVVSRQMYFKKLCNAMGAVLGTWFASVFFSLIVAVVLNMLNRTMAWYGRPLWVFFLYMVPTLLVLMIGIRLHAKYNHQVRLTK